ncbi:MAG: dockerin type I domain-containing protein [Phycisphaerales bacterium]|nr:dockerin type I domain-containing protein [Phycisphaerales bacterium]MCI0676157.1 dockerin type I domain-containing protein [Phycisphaerales bacterium]
MRNRSEMIVRRIGSIPVWLAPAPIAGLSVLIAAPLGAQTVNLSFAAPSLDRWNYPFAGNPGGNHYAAIFAPLTEAGFDPSFDNRDGQMVIGFDTADPPQGTSVPPNLGPARYTVTSATVFLTVESNETFTYDPTPDSYRTWLAPDDPEYLPDADAGHAVELFGTGFRYGFTATTYLESAPYSPLGSFGKGIRTAYPESAHNGQCVDVSNNVDERFDPTPFAVGLNAELTPGEVVPVDTELRFDINASDPNVQRSLRRALNEGMLDFSVASIFPSQQQTPGTYPRFYTKEHLAVIVGLVSAARLEMSVEVSGEPTPDSAGDVNADGVVNIHDLLAVIASWGACQCCLADANYDGVVNVSDLLIVIQTWG